MMTAANIVAQANFIAKTTGMLSLAGQKLNAILQELCLTYDLGLARFTTTFTFNIGVNGVGPYLLPTNYIRTQNGKQFYTFNGQQYAMTSLDQWEYDVLPVQPGITPDFPRDFYVDISQRANGGQPQEFVWPPPSIAVPVTIRYFGMQPDIVTPETSAVIPWFEYQNYLITRLAGEMMQHSDDDRADKFLTDKEEINPQGAGVLLRRYLNMKDDPEGRVKTVELDRRRFGGSKWQALPNTKTIGW